VHLAANDRFEPILPDAALGMNGSFRLCAPKSFQNSKRFVMVFLTAKLLAARAQIARDKNHRIWLLVQYEIKLTIW